VKNLEQARNRRKQWATLSRADLCKRFLDLAKAKQLSQVECILGTYLLHGEADATPFLGVPLVCCELPAERILQHNHLHCDNEPVVGHQALQMPLAR
jgi:hypothetical protein